MSKKWFIKRRKSMKKDEITSDFTKNTNSDFSKKMSRGKLSVVFKLKGGLNYSISNLVAISILKERKNEKVLKNIGGKLLC